MKKNNRSIKIIKQDPKSVKAADEKLPDPLPGLKGMKGGEKQQYNRQNQERIIEDYEKYGDDYTRALHCLRPETMGKILKRAAYKGRKNNTLVDRAFNTAHLANERVLNLKPEVDAIEEVLTHHFHDDQKLRKTLSDLFQLQSKLNAMAAELVLNRGQEPDDLTYSVNHEPRLKVDVTPEIIAHNEIKPLEVGTTSSMEVYRPIVSKKKAGKVVTSRLRKTRGTPRDRYEQSKWRHRRV